MTNILDRYRSIGAACVAGALVATGIFAAPQVAEAQEPAPFRCDGTPYIMQDGALFAVVPDAADPNSFEFEAVNETTTFGNSLALDPTNNLIYGIRGNARVETYDANGTVLTSLALQAPWPGGSSYAATVLGDGRYVAVSYNANYLGADNNLWSIDPTDGTVSHIGSLASRHADLSFNPADGYLYHVTGGKLAKIDPRDGSETTLPMEAGLASHGSSWFDAAGKLYVHHNNSGNLYQISGIGSEMATWRLAGQSASVRGADGANCIGGVEIDSAVVDASGGVVDGDDRVYSAGDSFVEQVTIFNNELPTGTRDYTVCDQLPEGLTYTGRFDQSSGNGRLVSGGAVGSTAFCYEVEAPSNLWQNPDVPAADPTVFEYEVQIAENAAGQLSHQPWIELDGDLSTKDIVADDAGTGTRDDATVVTASNPTPTATPTPEEEGQSFNVSDAGLGEGATCPATKDEDRIPPVDVDDVVVVDTETMLLETGFGPGFDDFEILSGLWGLGDNSLDQKNTCGFDYTALLVTRPVEHFAFKANFASVEGVNNGGIVFNQTSALTRSGASMIDLSEDGTVLRWGTYDATGHYVFQGSIDIDEVTADRYVTVGVESHGATATVFFDGEEVATMTNNSARGYVGLVTSKAKVSFTGAKLVALPAA